ncbi:MULTISPECIES: catalase/peroxidase HPI [Brevibacterium]|uniref:Catalase-peroxidase n=2 Tax=Brevibacterium antiquum TaxID=234835 RepID=A0A2H1KX28_9MICO|nr:MULTISPECIES: catalase/peroxidase HPI [Brevibacterium]SMX97793.1 catalase-peroxidase [Brevibacterium antiquum]SMY04297.1 catalase-peroxidase [Brevibacterium antiquum CNRZ 918]HCG56726.1 catalase/peroxidase HPI [Brevibacterium sp.]
MTETSITGGCPVAHTTASAPTAPDADSLVDPSQGDANSHWWPNRLNLKILAKNQPARDPMDEDFDYDAEFASLDYYALKADIEELQKTNADWWSADFGHYGPFMVRMAWHSAGTYRVQDGRGGGGEGQQRFAPLNSWPDNVGLDKARRLLWPVKKKYGKKISWADLFILAGNVGLESMGFKTFGYAGGRRDVWEPDNDVYWGSETEWLGTDKRYVGNRELQKPLAATTMGLIYVNPEGPEGKPDPLAAAIDIRDTFARMAMDDEETVALIAGGHTFGKTHGAAPESHKGGDPEAAPLEEMGLGWKSDFGTGQGNDTVGSGIEVTWTYHPTRWDNEFFHILFAYEWEVFENEGGHLQWRPIDGGGDDMVPMAQGDGRREPRMLTTDLSLRFDPIYGEISRRFKDDQKTFEDAFARAWFKLTHRDMGPATRYLGPEVPSEELIWQDPVPAGTPLDGSQLEAVKTAVRNSGLSVSQLVSTTWAAASSHRVSDFRGGVTGGRLRLEPQKSWEVNEPAKLSAVITVLEGIAADNGASFADVLAIAGAVGVETAAQAAGRDISVPVTTGRGDATQEQTDVASFSHLEPTHDGFRNYLTEDLPLSAEFLLLDRASLLGLTPSEMTVLIGGLRVLGANYQDSDLGVFTDRPGELTNDFFVNLLELGNTWKPVGESESANVYECFSPAGEKLWTGSRIDLLFGANSELRALAEVYASDDAQEKFVNDFVKAWSKLVEADRFDLHR